MATGAEIFRNARLANKTDRENERLYGQKFGIFPLTKAGKPYKTQEEAETKAKVMETLNPGKTYIVKRMF